MVKTAFGILYLKPLRPELYFLVNTSLQLNSLATYVCSHIFMRLFQAQNKFEDRCYPPSPLCVPKVQTFKVGFEQAEVGSKVVNLTPLIA